MTDTERQRIAMEHPIVLRLTREGVILLHFHSSSDNGPGETWHVLDPITGKVTLHSFSCDPTDWRISKKVMYRPSPMPSAEEVRQARTMLAAVGGLAGLTAVEAEEHDGKR